MITPLLAVLCAAVGTVQSQVYNQAPPRFPPPPAQPQYQLQPQYAPQYAPRPVAAPAPVAYNPAPAAAYGVVQPKAPVPLPAAPVAAPQYSTQALPPRPLAQASYSTNAAVSGFAPSAQQTIGGVNCIGTGCGPDFNPLLLQGSSRGFPGLKVRANQRAFQYAQGLLGEVLNNEIKKARIPPISQCVPEVQGCIQIYNLYVSRFRCAQAILVYPAPPNRIVLSIQNFDIGVTGNLGGQIVVLLPLAITGIVQANLHQVTATVAVAVEAGPGGTPYLRVVNCDVQIGYADVYIENGGLIGDIVNSQFRSRISNQVRSMAPGQICSQLPSIINDKVNGRLGSLIPRSINLVQLGNVAVAALGLGAGSSVPPQCAAVCGGGLSTAPAPQIPQLSAAAFAPPPAPQIPRQPSAPAPGAAAPAQALYNQGPARRYVVQGQPNLPQEKIYQTATLQQQQQQRPATAATASRTPSSPAPVATPTPHPQQRFASSPQPHVNQSTVSPQKRFVQPVSVAGISQTRPPVPLQVAQRAAIAQRFAASNIPSLPHQVIVVEGKPENVLKKATKGRRFVISGETSAPPVEGGRNGSARAKRQAPAPVVFVAPAANGQPPRLIYTRTAEVPRGVQHAVAVNAAHGVASYSARLPPPPIPYVPGAAPALPGAPPPSCQCPGAGGAGDPSSILRMLAGQLDTRKIADLFLSLTILSTSATNTDFTVDLSGEVSPGGYGGTPFGAFPLYLPYGGGRMLDLAVSDFTVNSALYQLHRRGFLTFRADSRTPLIGPLLRTTCSEDDELEDHGVELDEEEEDSTTSTTDSGAFRRIARILKIRRHKAVVRARRVKRQDLGLGSLGDLELCFGDLISDVAEKYPKKNITVVIRTARAPSVILSARNGGSAQLDLVADADLFIDPDGIQIGTITVAITVQANLRIVGNTVQGNAEILSLKLTDRTGSLGLPQDALDNLGNLGKGVLAKMANDALQKGIPLPALQNNPAIPFTVIAPQVQIVEHGLLVSTDIAVSPSLIASLNSSPGC